MNGWPSTLAEYLPALPLLSDFEVWIVSRAGYGFSEHRLDEPGDDEHAALQVGAALGEQRFAAHGDDFGGGVLAPGAEATAAGRRAARVRMARGPGGAGLSAGERAYVDGVNRWREAERGYGHVQANRPQTLGLALDDSPLGLLAWIADKWLSWSDPACPLDDDLILTTVTIYWVTRTIAPSMRAYGGRAPPRGKAGAGRGHRGQGGPAAAAARVARAQLRRSAQRRGAERGGHSGPPRRPSSSPGACAGSYPNTRSFRSL
jgi:hypothetical protein